MGSVDYVRRGFGFSGCCNPVGLLYSDRTETVVT